MRVGIVTIFDNENFGNKLQNYALQQILLDYAEAVVTIQNKPRFHSLWEWLRRGTPLAESEWLNRAVGKRRKAKLLEFQHAHIRTSRHTYCCGKTYRRLGREDRCDLYCAGSDQVWNPELGRTGGFNYLSFAGGRAFSYAASFGLDRLPGECRREVTAWLRQMPWLSVREKAGQRIAETLTGRGDIQTVIDPTLLLPRQQWEALARKPETPLPEKYLLLYFLGEPGAGRRAAIAEKAAQLGLPVVDILRKDSPFYEIGPEEFLGLIRNAALVYADSFHASVFSFLFQRPLVIFPREGNMGSRLENLAETFHLSSCIAGENQIPDVPFDPDYALGFQALEAERKKARNFLNKVFQSEKEREI